MKIINLLQARKVMMAHANEAISPRTAYKIAKFLRTTDSDESFFLNQAKALVQMYAEKDEDENVVKLDNDMVKIKNSSIEEYNQKLLELQNIDVEIPNLKLGLYELDKLKMSIADMWVINDFIEEGECQSI